MSSLDRLLKFLNSKNIAEELDDQELKEIADEVIKGYEIDDASRQEWLDINKAAVALIKNDDRSGERDRLYDGQSRLIFPLLAPATIQLASRLITHIVRNEKTVEFKILGQDQPMIDQQSGQPLPGKFVKQEKARKVSELMNYELLVESKSWLSDTHKAMHIISGWGVAFKQVYYDYVTKRFCSELICPEDVVINQNVRSLEQAPRITIKHRLTKNEIIEFIRAGYFLDIDLDSLRTDPDDENINALEETQPVYLFLCQTCYLDLDDDGYLEPYKVYVHKESSQVFGIVPAYEFQDLDISPKGKINRINRRLDIVDFHAIDDPEGGFYSIGLNYLLLHPNKALTAIQRQLIDAGSLNNAAAVTGFVTKAFKTKERSIRLNLGEFQVLDCNPTVDPAKQIIPMPFREPSQVLLNMFQILIETSKSQGFINDILTGDVEMQNVPATTTLAMTEQATRAFKPMIQKLRMSLKEEFKILFHLHAKYQDTKFIQTANEALEVTAADFDESSLDIVPVADPTQSSEAQKFARQRALLEGMQVFGTVTNIQEAAIRYYTDLGFPAPEALIQQQPQQPDPKIIEIQMKSQIEQQKLQLEQANLQLLAKKQELDNYKSQMQMQIKSEVATVKASEAAERVKKTRADTAKVLNDIKVQNEQLRLDAIQIGIDQQKVTQDHLQRKEELQVQKEIKKKQPKPPKSDTE